MQCSRGIDRIVSYPIGTRCLAFIAVARLRTANGLGCIRLRVGMDIVHRESCPFSGVPVASGNVDITAGMPGVKVFPDIFICFIRPWSEQGRSRIHRNSYTAADHRSIDIPGLYLSPVCIPVQRGREMQAIVEGVFYPEMGLQ